LRCRPPKRSDPSPERKIGTVIELLSVIFLRAFAAHKKTHLWWDTDGVADNIGPPNHQVRVGRNPNYAANESDGEPLLA